MSDQTIRRAIYLLMMVAVSLPLIFEYTVTPTQLKSADSLYEVVEKIDPAAGGVALVAMDFGPNTKAENEPQTEVVLEHLMRRRIPVAVLTQYPQAEGFLTSIPERIAERLMIELPGEKWEYGQDWVNLGYRPGGSLFVQALAKSENLIEDLDKDIFGTPLGDIPALQEVKTIRDIKLLAEFTGLVGMFDTYVQFFQTESYVPLFGHGCTSITIPEAYIYLDSGQLNGLLEGIAGAAWYSERLTRAHGARAPDSALVINTALGVAHLAVIGLIIFGNMLSFLQARKGGR